MRTTEDSNELEEELRHRKWDLFGIIDTRLPGEKC